MKQKKVQDFRHRISTLTENDIENIFLGKTPEEVRGIMKHCADEDNGDEWIYILRSYFFGIYCRKLHLYFFNGKVSDYYF